MSLEKLLAENMLRFGTKNLTESNITKLTGKKAPEDTFDNDSEQVKQHLIYEAFKKKWMSGVGDMSGFGVWAGSDGGQSANSRSVTASKEGPKRLKALQDRLKELNKPDVAEAVEEIINWVNGLITKNIILQRLPDVGNPYGFFSKIMSRYYFSTTSKLPTAENYDIWARNHGVNEIEKVSIDIAKVKVETAAKMFVAMTDADKIEALNFWQLEAQKIVESNKKRKGIRNKDFSKIDTLDQAIDLATTLKVRSGGGAIEKGNDTITKIVPITTQLTWPDINNPESLPDMQTMFIDNGYKLTDAVKPKIEAFIKAGIEAARKDGGTITEIKYGGMSMTSKVPTTFGGVDDEGNEIKLKSGQQNNIKLAEARANSIASYLKSMLEGLGLPDVELIAIDNRIQANQGPDWTDADRRNPKFGTPGNRTAEYNAKYGPYRKNSGFVEITSESKVTEEQLTPSYTGNTGYTYIIKWGTKHRPPRKSKVRGSAGGGESYIGVVLNTASCPPF